MFVNRSRYKDAVAFTEPSGFAGVRPREIGAATAVIEHTLQAGDRLDLLARHYYNNDRLWWRILDANPDILYAGDLSIPDRVGETILIPRVRE
ncbi:MAG: hypothetical protein AUJ57_06515 [Zetaproteobacteria bacterium CG1_02_53_45]|nr:MAG: hypothetical protein AUJ57_06515 [Zetaproteobacteria bacterium CG1_02_53_45]